jgi:uncharacterized lipoprotein YbaY/heat shock protein HslJ
MGVLRLALVLLAALPGTGVFALESLSLTALYRERMAMPPGAVFEARIENVSRADAPSVTIGSVRVEDAGNPPYRVEIPYNPAVIDDRFTYAVRASLTLDGRLLFTTDTHVPVLSRGAPHAAEVVMVRVAGSAEPEAVASVPMLGEFTYFADAARFVDCRTGADLPVAMEGDYLALERAYLAARAEPQAPLVVTLDAGVAPREGMEGGTVETLVVHRFDAVWPGLTCERARADSDFANTYWRIVSLEGTPLMVAEGAREPHVIFRAEESAYAATVGCNQVNGGFERTGGAGLTLKPGAMTMMACPPPLDTAERQMIDVFGRTATFRILGPTMALLDADGAVIAHLEAVYLP